MTDNLILYYNTDGGDKTRDLKKDRQPLARRNNFS